MPETRARRGPQADLRLLADAGAALGSTLDPDLLVRRFAGLIVPAVADACEIDIVESGGTLRRTVLVEGIDSERLRRRELQRLELRADHPITQVMRSGETLVIDAHTEIGRIALGPGELETTAASIGIRHAVILPLQVRSSTIGAVSIGCVERAVGAEDIALLEELSRRFALAYDNAVLHRNQRSIAETLQRGLLPASLPVVAGLDMAARYWVSGAGHDVGGDFYDVVVGAERPELVTVFIGDVAGKGIEAASRTALARHTLRAAALQGEDPATALRWLHRALSAERSQTFVSAVVLQFQVTEARVSGTVAIGGHPRPLIRRASGEIEQIEPAGAPPGMPVWIEPPLLPIELRDGDAVLLYTDGVTDVPGDAAMTISELHDMVRSSSGGTDEILDSLSAELERRRPRRRRSDDIALMALQATSSTASLEFPAERSSPAMVRRWLAKWLGPDNPGLDDVLLCASELVSNVVLHTGMGGSARVRRVGSRIRVEVIDPDGRGLAIQRGFERESVTGRGLHLVDDIALDWGSDKISNGKVVWFEVAGEERVGE